MGVTLADFSCVGNFAWFRDWLYRIDSFRQTIGGKSSFRVATVKKIDKNLAKRV